jgi:hypothetical protein
MENKVAVDGDFKINSLIWTNDLLLLSDSEAAYNLSLIVFLNTVLIINSLLILTKLNV